LRKQGLRTFAGQAGNGIYHNLQISTRDNVDKDYAKFFLLEDYGKRGTSLNFIGLLPAFPCTLPMASL
jgi:hypothetical protein